MFNLGLMGNGQTLYSFYSIKEDVMEDSSIQTYRGGDNGLFFTEKSSKAAITLDIDFVVDADFKSIRDVLLNRQFPNKMYIREPGNINGSLIQPDLVDPAFYLYSNNSAPALSDFVTNFASIDYSYIQGWTTPVAKTTNTYDYIHYLFNFDLTSYFASGGDKNNMMRLTLFMQTPFASRSDGSNYGIKVSAYNYAQSIFTEVYRRSITLSSANQQAASIRPFTGYSKLTDFISTGGSPNIVTFMLSTLQPRAIPSTLTISTGYVACIVNGFMVRAVDPFNLNWRDTVTVVGRTGSIKLQEV